MTAIFILLGSALQSLSDAVVYLSANGGGSRFHLKSVQPLAKGLRRRQTSAVTQIAMFMGPTWGPPGSCRPQMCPMLAPWTLLSGIQTLGSCSNPQRPWMITISHSFLLDVSIYSLVVELTWQIHNGNIPQMTLGCLKCGKWSRQTKGLGRWCLVG